MSLSDFDVFVVLVLIVINGMFSMSEIAIISSRKARLQQRAEEGDAGARTALDLADSPNLFLSTVQIGITLVGVMSGAFGGASISHRLSDILSQYAVLAPYSDTLSLFLVVLAITYLSLVIGELVPKRLALDNPEKIASIAAKPMRFLSIVGLPAVRLLSLSTDVVLKVLRVRPSSEPPVTEEEIKVLIEQATMAGVFEEAEQDIVERVLRLGDRRVGGLMTPRKKVIWLDINDTEAEIRQKIKESFNSRFPVCQGRLGNILGVVHVKDLLMSSLEKKPFDLKSLIQKPLFVLENTHALRVLELFKETGSPMAMVIDEYGTIEGLVTLNDLLEAIVGDIPSRDEFDEAKVVQREDGSWLVDGMLSVGEIKEKFRIKKLPGERSGLFETLGGFVMARLDRIPSAGDSFRCCGYRFEVMDMDGHRVDKVLIEILPEKPGDEEG